jgi:uncharacterized MAPEG superfamily protein
VTTPFRCLIVVAVLPYVIAGIGGYLRTKQFGSADNNHPRLQAAKLEGIAARAWAAQANAWEALAIFATAVFMTHLVHADEKATATACEIYLATRIAHPALYLANLATARTLVFIVGLACLARLFLLASAA